MSMRRVSGTQNKKYLPKFLITYILLDLFLYNDFLGVATTSYRPLSSELTQKLLAKKAANSDIVIQVITDPINVMYGGHVSADLEALRQAGVSVIVTDLKPLRDSNPVYSSLWRTAFQWFGNSDREGYLPNPLDADSPDLGLRTYLSMLNFKANHRKVVLADYRDGDRIGFSTLITSANPHDGSSAHSNIAVRVDAELWQAVLTTESAVAGFSDHTFVYPTVEASSETADPEADNLQVQLLTEQAIKDRLLVEIDQTQKDDTIDIVMFYIADRDMVTAIKRADERGVTVRLLLDPNKDAFGREKNGTPNRQVAHELITNSTGNTQVRWCDTHGEQCHSKLLLIKKGKTATLVQGSANYTKRNLDDYNLETNLVLTGTKTQTVFIEASDFFEDQWHNKDEKIYSAGYEKYQDDSKFKTVLYRLKESTGLSRW
jgi:HKD family nuclease